MSVATVRRAWSQQQKVRASSPRPIATSSACRQSISGIHTPHVELSAASLRAQTDGSKRGPGGKIPRNKIPICRIGCESLHIDMHVTAGMLAGLCSSTEWFSMTVLLRYVVYVQYYWRWNTVYIGTKIGKRLLKKKKKKAFCPEQPWFFLSTIPTSRRGHLHSIRMHFC